MTTVLKYPLLNKEQEILLARQVQAWVTADAPDRKTERAGRRAYEKLINCNLRLVISVARRYTNRCKLTEMLDIIQEGNIGSGPRGEEVRSRERVCTQHLRLLVDQAGHHSLPQHQRQAY